MVSFWYDIINDWHTVANTLQQSEPNLPSKASLYCGVIALDCMTLYACSWYFVHLSSREPQSWSSSSHNHYPCTLFPSNLHRRLTEEAAEAKSNHGWLRVRARVPSEIHLNPQIWSVGRSSGERVTVWDLYVIHVLLLGGFNQNKFNL